MRYDYNKKYQKIIPLKNLASSSSSTVAYSSPIQSIHHIDDLRDIGGNNNARDHSSLNIPSEQNIASNTLILEASSPNFSSNMEELNSITEPLRSNISSLQQAHQNILAGNDSNPTSSQIQNQHLVNNSINLSNPGHHLDHGSSAQLTGEDGNSFINSWLNGKCDIL